MKRAALVLVFLAVLGTVGAIILEGELFAAPPESEELAFPRMSPAFITADDPTFITFTATLTDLDIKRPKLQVFDSAKGKWKTIKPLKDNGKGEDEAKDDRVFTKRLWFLDSGGTTQVGFEKRNGEIKVKRQVPSPAQLRLVAKRKGQRGFLVSQGLLMSPGQDFDEAVFGIGATVPAEYQRSPLSWTGGDYLAPGTGGVLARFRWSFGDDPEFPAEIPRAGCAISINVEDNAAMLPLAEWLNVQGHMEVGLTDEPITVAGIPAVLRTGIGGMFDEPYFLAFVPRDSQIFTVGLEAYGDTLSKCRQDAENVLASIYFQQ